ncbi:DUF3110 domain-containing protein [Synechococcales cyanobacterium C]|uniref:DUF3110 domain-containing protein n=1 Tax=Petrachloros mirabilis ULC683 TaxID=2781853 RepID=A0A8K1ZXX2_9CYAN|nr:DUF3110 domain-containing protein [Petrachloros mirabilis]NCJ06918.1 DUF3110 domain-containing protein [Petrachloros mirabilis ULC683]
MPVYVLLFNARTANEGIHTLRINDANGLSQEVVLAFESEDDATRFGLLLEAQDFPEATVEPLDLEEVRAFCNEAGYVLQPVPEGTLVVPPGMNLDTTDWHSDADPRPPLSEMDQIRQRLEKLL